MFLLSTVPDGRVFGLDQQTLISIGINLFNVIILAVLLSWLLYNPVRKFMAARTARIASQIEGAARQAQDAEQLRVEYEQKIAEIAVEREEILEGARKMAAENAKQTLAAAKAEADGVRERAADEIEHERERVRAEMKQVIIEVSTAMTEKILVASVDDAVYERMFDATVSEMENAKWLR
ncbi:MAG: F0F1 ATP synthase subunit B [Oscillospiraceae bacterium]|nr:F0F1 ATP synthase subunit B [Oscillospiraceae bacterium]